MTTITRIRPASPHPEDLSILRSGPGDITHTRSVSATALGSNSDEQLKGRLVAAICANCGGWTMVHGEASSRTAREWARRAYVSGDMIVFWRNTAGLGPTCPQSEKPPRERTCAE